MAHPSHDDPDPRCFLPLTPVAFEILLAFVEGPRHGYGVMLEVEGRRDGIRTLRPGTLYRAIGRLLEQGLLEASCSPPASPAGDQRRRYYRLTTLGRGVAAAEARRLERAVEAARAKKLFTSVLTGN